jgi:hypothetical protein
MGIGSAKDLGVGLHIKTADAGGGTPGAGRDNLIIEDSGSTGITILGGTSNDIGIAMGDSDDANIGMINYNHSNNIMTFQAGGNANMLGITSSTVVINEDSDDVDFRVESNGNANMLVVNGGGDRVGIAGDPDLGVGLHIRTADSGASVASDMDELVLENSTNTGLTILSATNGLGRIAFGDSGDNAVGSIDYNHDGNLLKLGTSGALGLQIDGNGHVTMPKQTFFVATPTSNSADIAADTTHTIIANSEIIDRNSDYNTSNGTFTAPVTGAYALTMNVGIGDYDHDNNYNGAFINTSNRRWTTHFMMGNALSADGTHFITATCVVDMDASDTATFQFRNDQGTQQPFIQQEFTFVSGYLLG